MNTVSKLTNQIENFQTHTLSCASVYSITAAILIGVSILSVVGFAGPEIIHNTAHDIRHSMAFPCH